MTLNRRIFITFFPLFLLLFSASLLSYFSFLVYREEQRLLYQENLLLHQLTRQYDEMKNVYIGYLEFKKFEDLEGYLRESAALKEKMLDVESTLRGDAVSLILRDILGMMETYLEIADRAVVQKRNRRIAGYYQEYLSSLEVDQFIGEFTGKYNNALLQRNADRYRLLEAGVTSVQRFFLILFLVLSLAGLWLMNYLSRLISQPVRALTGRAEKIADGHFEAKPVVGAGAAEELRNLSTTFDIMSDRIRENFQLKDALHGEEMKNLKIRERASQAEFAALQSQINPHFMFNTLNAGVQLAMFEEAEKTEEYLNDFAGLLRYSFRDLQEPVRIREELECIDLYLSLMRIRYGEIFSFSVEKKENIQEWMIPRTVMQPIIENLFVHVLQYVDHLDIRIVLEEKDQSLLMTFLDNGPGFSEEEAARINSFDSLDLDRLSGLTRGRIGLINVYVRLRFFYGEAFRMRVPPDSRGGALVLILPEEVPR